MTVPCYNKFRPRLWSVWSSREEFAKMKLLLSLSMPFFSSFATNVSIFAAGTLKSAVLRFSGDNRGIEGNEDIFTTWPLSKWNTVYSVASNDDGTQQRRSKRLLFPPFFLLAPSLQYILACALVLSAWLHILMAPTVVLPTIQFLLRLPEHIGQAHFRWRQTVTNTDPNRFGIHWLDLVVYMQSTRCTYKQFDSLPTY